MENGNMIKKDFITTNKMSLMEKLISEVLRNVKADENVPPSGSNAGDNTPPATPPAQPSINFETLIANARKEEKDKLYPEITKLKADVEKLVQKNNEYLLTIGQKDTEIAEIKKQVKALEKKLEGTPDSEEVKSLKSQVATLQAEKEQLVKEKDSVKLESYKTQKIAEAKGEIIPELVFGTTQEDIDKSFDVAVAKYKEIISKIQTPNTPPPNSNNIPPANPNLFQNSTITSMSEEQIRGMDSKAWAEMRKTLGLK